MRFTVLLFAALSLPGQSGLNRPFLGEMIDRQGHLRPVYGAGGSFQIAMPAATGVLSSACSATLCLAKTESALIATDGSAAAPAGAALIALDATGASVYFPQTNEFARWQGGALTPLSLRVNETILGLRSTGSGLNFAVERSGLIWITGTDGSTLDCLPPDATKVLLLPSATVYSTPSSLVLRQSDGTEARFPAPGVTSLIALGEGYVEAVASGALYVFRTVAEHEQVLQLPDSVLLKDSHR